MKKIKNGIILVITVLLVLVVIGRYSNIPKVTAQDSVKALFNVCVKGDPQDILKIGMDKKSTDTLAETKKQTFNTQLRMNFSSQGLPIKEEQIQKIFEARNEAMKRLTATAEVVSKSDKTVDVKLKSTYINETEISNKAATDAIEQVGQGNKSKITEAYINNLIQAYKSAKPSADTKEKVFKCTMQNKLWLPESAFEFGKEAASLASGM